MYNVITRLDKTLPILYLDCKEKYEPIAERMVKHLTHTFPTLVTERRCANNRMIYRLRPASAPTPVDYEQWAELHSQIDSELNRMKQDWTVMYEPDEATPWRFVDIAKQQNKVK